MLLQFFICSTINTWTANSPDPDQTPQSAASESTQFATHTAVFDTSTGSKINLFKFYDRQYGKELSHPNSSGKIRPFPLFAVIQENVGFSHASR